MRLLQTASAEMKKPTQEGKCRDQTQKDFTLPGFGDWTGYATGLPFIARRCCGLWGRGA